MFFEDTLSSHNFLIFKYSNVFKYDFLLEKNSIPFFDATTLNQSMVFDNYLYFKKSSFISFFLNNMLDVPICFKKSPSLKRKTFELPLLKFTNYLMKKGKREQTLRLFFRSIIDLFDKLKFDQFNSELLIKRWLNLYFLLNTNFVGSGLSNYDFANLNMNFYLENYTPILLFDTALTPNNRVVDDSFYLKNYFLSKLNQVLPIFSYFIYSVDKNIRKYSRGKSGKYVFIWKYIAPYKRLNLAMKWIAKEVKFSQNKKLKDRINDIFSNLIFSPQNSFAWKSKVFSHNYVFRNLRKTLMSTLKTSSIS